MSIFSKHLANEVAGRGVRINRVTRAGVLAERMECRMPEGAKRQAAASVPPGRMVHRRPCRRHCTSYRRRRPRSWASPSTFLVASRSLDPRRWKAQVAHRSSYYREPLSQENSDEPAKRSILQRQGDGRRPVCCGFWVRDPDLLGGRVPTVPPGLVILLAAAGLVALSPWRWAPAIGIGVGLFVFVGFFAGGAVSNLFDPSRFGVLVGAWIQFLAVIAVIVAGGVATTRNYGTRS